MPIEVSENLSQTLPINDGGSFQGSEKRFENGIPRLNGGSERNKHYLISILRLCLRNRALFLAARHGPKIYVGTIYKLLNFSTSAEGRFDLRTLPREQGLRPGGG
jgi:hypothetical protein